MEIIRHAPLAYHTAVLISRLSGHRAAFLQPRPLLAGWAHTCTGGWTAAQPVGVNTAPRHRLTDFGVGMGVASLAVITPIITYMYEGGCCEERREAERVKAVSQYG